MMTARSKPIEFVTAFGSYVSGGVIGEGGAGTVYAATDDQGGQVAIKILDPDKATRQRLKRFQNEYLFGFRNQHRNLVRVLDFGVVTLRGRGAPFYVMPRYTGSLRSLLLERMSTADRFALFDQILSGVEAAHLLKVFHRDLKPENILHNGLADIVVADFGIAHFEADDLYTAAETRPGERLANFLYAAPEQRHRGKAVDQRADVFALGLMLHEFFTGAVPHGAGYRTVGEVSPDLAWVDDVIESMIQNEPAARPSGIADVRSQLRLHSDQFATRQKISALSKQVVSVGEIDDPLAIEPLRITGVDYERGVLVIQVDKVINDQYLFAFKNMGSHTSLMGAEPERFSFRGNEARVAIQEAHAQAVLDYFKGWLPTVAATYRSNLKAQLRHSQQAEETRLRAEREELERRERVRKTLRY